MSAGLKAGRSAAVIEAVARMRSRKPGAKRSTCRVTSSVASRVEPAGTWTYAQSTCLPVRAPASDRAPTAAPRARRDGRSRLHGRRRSRSPRPRRACRRGARWGSVRRRDAPTESDRPARSRPSRPPARRRIAGSLSRTRPVASGWVSTSRGDVSRSSRSPASGSPQSSSASEVTGCRVSTVPPCARRSATRASAMRCGAAARERPAVRRHVRGRRGRDPTPPHPATGARCWHGRARPSAARRLVGRERPAPERRPELQRTQPEAHCRDRMTGHAQQLRAGEVHDVVEMAAQRADDGTPGIGIPPESCRRCDRGRARRWRPARRRAAASTTPPA